MTVPSAGSREAGSHGFRAGLLAFGAFGGAFGVWQVALPDVTLSLGLSPSALGLALSLGFAVSIPTMLVAGRATDRWGTRVAISVAAAWFGLSLAAVVGVATYVAFAAAVVSFLAAAGMYDVAINAAAMRAEERRRSDVMTLAHAAFSGSAAAGAIFAGVALGAGLPFRLLYLAAAVVALLVIPAMLTSRERMDDPRTDGPPPRPVEVPGRARRALAVLAATAALAFLCEGAMENWSAIYLRSSLDLPAALGASGVAVFHGAMLVGRLFAAGSVRRFARVTVLRASGTIAAIGGVVALATDAAIPTLLGFLIVGLALAAVAPIAFSLAGKLYPDARGGATARITTLGYGGFLVGPALIGALAEVVGLRLALGVIVVAGVLIAGLTLRLGAMPDDAHAPGRD